RPRRADEILTRVSQVGVAAPLTGRSPGFHPERSWLSRPRIGGRLGGCTAFVASVRGPGMAVEVGEQAPDFELRDQHGTPVRLSSFRGTKHVVLVFYPLAFSGVCAGELCSLRDEFPEVNRDDVELLTVSVDSTFAHRAWADAEHFQ